MIGAVVALSVLGGGWFADGIRGAAPPDLAEECGGERFCAYASAARSGQLPAPTATATPEWTADNPRIVACHDLYAPLSKTARLPDGCEPQNLVDLPGAYSWGAQRMTSAAASAMESMLNAAASAGHAMFVASSYRSYADQAVTYNYWVNELGQEEADRTSARPGHSEHQLGTTADLTSASVGYELLESFGGTPEGIWVRENSWKYGFVISYPANKEHITGYAYEPWHVRYVGPSVAEAVTASGKTLTEFLK